MRLHDLERKLTSIPPHPAPKAHLEQYATPAQVAAPLLFEAWTLGDIEGKRVADLGAGTGILGIGAALLGAREVLAVEVDAAALGMASAAAARLGVALVPVAADVRGWAQRVDTVIMNPPFGAQVAHADRAFLDAAFASAPVVYSMHNAATRAFVEGYARDHGFDATHRWLLKVKLAHQYRHQARESAEIDVIALRMTQSSQ